MTHIPITEPYLPPVDEYNHYIQGIWRNKWLTNHGPLVKRLEIDIMKLLDIPNIILTTNGTTALQIAINSLPEKGEIITTPYSYIATTNSILWQNFIPVFVDIDINTFNIDANKIENKITNKTVAILPTLVYGNACQMEKIEILAIKHNVKLIYDAAHAFGSIYKGESLFNFGDISIASFHATKIFHTIEGGALISKDRKINSQLKLMANFGHISSNKFVIPGINGKNSEFHAAMGLCILPHFNEIKARRKIQYLYYRKKFQSTNLDFQEIADPDGYNYAYFPIVFQSHIDLLCVENILMENLIFPRRYFSPSLNKLPFVEYASCPISESLSERILCLPLYDKLTISQQDYIIDHIVKFIN